jgi:hypothetical protein
MVVSSATDDVMVFGGSVVWVFVVAIDDACDVHTSSEVHVLL